MKSEENQRRAAEVDLCLAISGALLQPGERRELRAMAAFVPLSWQALWLIEQRALMKVRKKLRCDPKLRQELKEFFELR